MKKWVYQHSKVCMCAWLDRERLSHSRLNPLATPRHPSLQRSLQYLLQIPRSRHGGIESPSRSSRFCLLIPRRCIRGGILGGTGLDFFDGHYYFYKRARKCHGSVSMLVCDCEFMTLS